MSGLASALSSALSGLMVTSGQSALVSRNVSRASDENYTRKLLDLTTDFMGNARASGVVRVTEKRLADHVSLSGSRLATESTLNAALQRLSETVGDVEDDGSIAWSVAQLENALQDFGTNPASQPFANQAISAAAQAAGSLNSAASIVASVRADADAGIKSAVEHVNSLLRTIADLNTRITQGGANDSATVELMDQRDAAIRELSGEISLRVVARPNNAVAIYTDSGATLFDISPRQVSFQPSFPLAPGLPGNAVYVDGVQVTGQGSPMPLQSGKIAAHVTVRDQLAATYEAQLDEVARGLVTMFAETDQGVPALLPPATGLFSYGGSPAVPAAMMLYAGLASEIRLNPQFDLGAGGDPMLLRDGGANGAAYVWNTGGLAGFQDRLTSLASDLNVDFSFSSGAGLPTSTSLTSFAASSAGWLEQKRADSFRARTAAEAAHQRSTEALARKSGVNIDEEMSILLNIEMSYQASAKVVTAVDQMLSTLMQIVR
jgi:flagellar hook-associated protein 1 FlgK